jgi:dCTP deaminase
MGVLVDWQIEELCLGGMISPFEPTLVNPASIDVRVGDTAVIETEEGWRNYDMRGHTEENPLWVMPKEFLLVATLETFNMPSNVCGEFKLKSSRAREGWNNCLAVWIDPHFVGSKLTMELINECRFHHLPLYPGLRIGQIIIHSCQEPIRSYALVGRYNFDTVAQTSKG